ncbi:MAG TPA: methyltransferase domain-containing protein [Candidatus Acidoferrales bacterium]|nr:methyltransferase domain-containing protein [Candidatus Acidoferrales bacterium]
MKARSFSWILFFVIAFAGLWAAGDLGNKAADLYRRWFRDPAVIRDYLETHAVRKLHIGAGGNDPPGWLNTDIAPNRDEVYLDATKPFPLPDGSFHYIFSEHMIQAVSWEGGLAMLKECRRVLAPGGKLRIVTPNLAKFVQLLNEDPDADARRFMAAKSRLHGWRENPVTGVHIFNRQMRDWGTQFLYDPPTLRKSLELAGFTEIAEYAVDTETDPVFREAEIRTRNEGSDLWIVNRWESMAFEAVR